MAAERALQRRVLALNPLVGQRHAPEANHRGRGVKWGAAEGARAMGRPARASIAVEEKRTVQTKLKALTFCESLDRRFRH